MVMKLFDAILGNTEIWYVFIIIVAIITTSEQQHVAGVLTRAANIYIKWGTSVTWPGSFHAHIYFKDIWRLLSFDFTSGSCVEMMI